MSNQPARRDNAMPINLPHNSAGRVGQGTAVEQSRATSEIYYRVLVAQQIPRDEDQVLAEMRRACAKFRLAEKAFYALPRGGSTINGPSVHLARELARIWGNLDYGIHELRQDDEFGQSEILAFAWDLQTNTRSGQTFIVPHKRDAGRSTQKLTSMADIYQNNANMGARRVRQAIYSVLPDWFTEEAEEICRATIAQGDGSQLAERISKATKLFDSKFGVTEDLLVTRVGKPTAKWTADNVADLQVLYRSLEQKEVTVQEAFPGTRVTADEVAGGASAATTPASTPAAPAEEPPAEDEEAQWAADAQADR